MCEICMICMSDWIKVFAQSMRVGVCKHVYRRMTVCVCVCVCHCVFVMCVCVWCVIPLPAPRDCRGDTGPSVGTGDKRQQQLERNKPSLPCQSSGQHCPSNFSDPILSRWVGGGDSSDLQFCPV